MANDSFDPTAFDATSGRRLQESCVECCGPEITIRPELLYFNWLTVGAFSDWVPFTIENTGTENVGIDTMELVGDQPDDFEMTPAFEAFLLVPGEIATVNIRFRPKANGVRNARVSIKSMSLCEIAPVVLVGVGGEMVFDQKPDWAYRYGSFAIDQILSDEILLDFHVDTAHRLQSNFAGCKFSVGTPPLADYVIIVKKDGIQIGTITIHADGTVTPATNGNASVAVAVNSIISVHAPGVSSSVIERLRLTFVGVI